MDGEVLAGGVANAGAVIRLGDRVQRPLPSNHQTLHQLLRFLRNRSDVLAPLPLGVEGDSEVVEFISGDVAIDPFPKWSNSIDALESVARLLRLFHDATVDWPIPSDATWSDELADPNPGADAVICHNDVCMENVVFRSGRAAALIDFDFAGPGRRVWDVAQTARYWIPLTDPSLPAACSRGIVDPISRLTLFVDAYGLDAADRSNFVNVVLDAEHAAREFVERQVEHGIEAFAQMWNEQAQHRFEAKLTWITANADTITSALD